MEGQGRSERLDVSEYYFRLTTETIRLFSNSERRYTTLGEIVDKRATHLVDIVTTHLADDLRCHLRLIPADGNVPIEMTILETSAASIEEAIPVIERSIRTSVRFKEAISLLCFDWMVSLQLTDIVGKLGLTANEADLYTEAYTRTRN